MVQNNSQIGKDVFCHPPSSTFFLERIMSHALEEYDRLVSIGDRNITNLRFADDIDALAEETLVESIDKICTMYKMEISAEKTKLMTNISNDTWREIKVKGLKLGPVTSSSTLEQLFQMMILNQRFSQGLHKPLQLFEAEAHLER